MHPRDIKVDDYDYDLPDKLIALRPLARRDESRLLIYREEKIIESNYRNIAAYLPSASTLVFNDTQVVNARIIFTKNTGAKIEIFCLEPLDASAGYHNIFSSTGTSVWKCFIGGAAKWREGDLSLDVSRKDCKLTLTATLEEKKDGYFIVKFSWTPAGFAFAKVLQLAGSIPLPPYIKRTPDELDSIRYQTLFAKNEGSVAAPTAALHFTDEVMNEITGAGVGVEKITLHVGAGTFKPVNAERLAGHDMHAEWIDVTRDTIRNLAAKSFIIPVGTTSLRTLESLYWMGIKIMRGDENIHINQWEPYLPENISCNETMQNAFESLGEWMESRGMERIFTQTSILIAPGYKMRVAKALITNFHQPKSTLLLLIAAAIGESWKSVYAYALEKNFRFLSYGDGNLLFFPQG